MDKFNVCRNTVKKYIKMSNDEVEQITFVNERKSRLIDDYINIIYKMMLDKIPFEYIIEYVKQKGYTGSIGTLKDYMVSLIKNNNLPYNCSKILFQQYKYPDDVIIITRLELLKYILTIDTSKKNENLDKYIDIIKEQYPLVQETHNRHLAKQKYHMPKIKNMVFL